MGMRGRSVGKWLWVVGLCAAGALVGCGDDDGTTAGTDGGAGVDSGGGGTDGGGGTTDGGGGGMTDGGGGMTDAGPSDADSGAGATGCAMGGAACGEGLMCCAGEPYPAAGICLPSCPAVSDRARKEAITPVDRDAILAEVATLPISEWSYRGERQVRHVGPMAQDFRAAFGLGESDKTIHPIDESGIALAALQALYGRVTELERTNGALRERNDALEGRVRAIEARARRRGTHR